MKIIKFLLIGLALSLTTEIFRFTLIETRTQPWLLMIFAYILLLLVSYAANKIIHSDAVYYVLAGLFGLLVEIYWFKQLDAIKEAGFIGWLLWFSYWGSIMLIPRLALKRKITLFLRFFFVIALVLAAIFYISAASVNPDLAGAAAGFFFLSLNIPFIRFFWQQSKIRKTNRQI